MFEGIFGSKSRAKLIRLLFTKPDRSYYLREIATLLDLNTNQVKRELDILEQERTVKSSRKGMYKHYETNKNCAIYAELCAIAIKMVDISTGLKKGLEGINGIKAAFIYGSYARGKHHGKSDVDLMIIGTPNVEKLDEEIWKFENETRLSVDYVVYDPKEFGKKINAGFVRNVWLDKKMFLIGDANGLK